MARDIEHFVGSVFSQSGATTTYESDSDAVSFRRHLGMLPAMAEPPAHHAAPEVMATPATVAKPPGA